MTQLTTRRRSNVSLHHCSRDSHLLLFLLLEFHLPQQQHPFPALLDPLLHPINGNRRPLSDNHHSPINCALPASPQPSRQGCFPPAAPITPSHPFQGPSTSLDKPKLPK